MPVVELESATKGDGMKSASIVIEKYEISDRDEWLKWRSLDVTASEIGTLFNAEPTFGTSALSLYLDKTEGRGADFDNDALRRGRIGEALAIPFLEETRPDWEPFFPKTYIRSPMHRIGATPDLVNQHNEPIEVKIPLGNGLDDWEGEPPLRYQLQTLVQMMMMNAQRGWVLGVQYTGFKARAELFEINRDAAAEARIIEAVRDFWQRVAVNNPPAINPELDEKTVLRAFPQANGQEVDLLSDNRLPGVLANLIGWKAERKELDSAIKSAETEIKGKLGDAEFGLINGFDVSWKSQERKAYSVAASSYRVLRIKDIRPQRVGA